MFKKILKRLNTSLCLITGFEKEGFQKIERKGIGLTEFFRSVLLRKYIYTIYLHVKAYYPSFKIDNYFTYLWMCI